VNNIAVILNKKAHNAEQIYNYLQAFDQEGILYTFFPLEPEDLPVQIQRCLEEFDLLLVGGGDGSIRSAAQYCANTSITLGVLPLGTMNHFAKEVGLPLTTQEIVEAIKKPRLIKIDLAEVNGNVFVNNSSLGFYPKLAKKRDYYAKHYYKWLSYIPSIIKTFSYHDAFNFKIKAEEINLTLHTSFLMISNNLYSYKFPINIARDSFHEATLGIYFLKHGKMTTRKIFHQLFRKRNNFDVLTSKKPVEIEVLNKATVSVSLDGDTMTMQTPLIYRSIPNALQLLMLS
jgi:diacylglycerol kinase family enzyme